MKRQIIFPGQIPLETDLLNTNKNTMVALGKLIAGLIGTATFANGLGCTPNSPAALNVVISPGELYSLQNIDGTAYSSLAADTAHQIMKQGIVLDAVTLACAAPGTAGYSINYLIEAAYSEVDTLPVVLPYYNASNPSQAYSGPANAGTTNYTARDGQVSLVAKAGISTTTGAQVTPAADSGYVGLWVVTVAYGQTAIVAGNIVQAASAPFDGITAQLNVANTFTQAQSAPTPAQFDTTLKLANTTFVKSSGLQYASAGNISASRALVSADIGSTLLAQGAYTLTVGTPASINARLGDAVTVSNYGSSNLTVAFSGSTYVYGTAGQTANIVAQAGESLTLVASSTTTWNVISSTAGMGNIGSFGAVLSPNGYRKLPSGDIEQWGVSAVSGSATVNFPIAFPNSVFAITTTLNSAESITSVVGAPPNNSSFTLNNYTSSTGNITTSARNNYWRAIGK